MTPEERLQWDLRAAQSQLALVDFLRADLDLAFTFLDTAEIEYESDPEHYRAAIRKAREALDTIRHLEGRIRDRLDWRIIHDRADELEKAIERFPQ